MRGVWVSENVQKLVGVVVMAVLVVVGVAVSSGDDTDFTRNRSFSSAAGTFVGADRLEPIRAIKNRLEPIRTV